MSSPASFRPSLTSVLCAMVVLLGLGACIDNTGPASDQPIRNPVSGSERDQDSLAAVKAGTVPCGDSTSVAARFAASWRAARRMQAASGGTYAYSRFGVRLQASESTRVTFRNGIPDRREVLSEGPDPEHPELLLLYVRFVDETAAKGNLDSAAFGEPALPLDSLYARCRDILPADTLGRNRFRVDANLILRECGTIPEAYGADSHAQVNIAEMQWGAEVDSPRPVPWQILFPNTPVIPVGGP